MMHGDALTGGFPTNPHSPARRQQVAKLLGADIELGNFIEGAQPPTGRAASRLLLQQIPGVARNYVHMAQDAYRRFLWTNGGCAYIDLDHAELPLPEVTNAWDFVAVWHAMLRVARTAMLQVNEQLAGTQRLRVFANNSDGLGHSYGSHCNVLMVRTAFDDLFDRKLQHLLFLAAHQVSSIVYTGQGKVGAENAAPAVPYQLSQRADFFETLSGLQTTYHRPIVNTRDEPLCGPFAGDDATAKDLARLHVIFYDSNLCHVACLLKVGVLQIITAMIEAEDIDVRLILDDPVDAVVKWSHDPSLQQRVRLADGRWLTAVEHQQQLHTRAVRFVERGRCDAVVPGAEKIVELWGNVLERLAARDFDSLAGSLDWVLKRSILERALANHAHLNWNSPELKQLDHLYSSLDPADGLFWIHEQAGVVESLVSRSHIERFVYEPPADTRAWTRAMLLRVAGVDRVNNIDWDRITFRLPGSHGYATYQVLWMQDPRQWTRAQTQHLFRQNLTLAELTAELRRLAVTSDVAKTVSGSHAVVGQS